MHRSIVFSLLSFFSLLIVGCNGGFPICGTDVYKISTRPYRGNGYYYHQSESYEPSFYSRVTTTQNPDRYFED